MPEEPVLELLDRVQKAGLFNDESLEPLLELKLLAEGKGLDDVQMQVYYMLGKFHLLRLQNEEAQKYFSATAKKANELNDFEQQGFALDRLGITMIRMEKPDTALICFQKSIKLYQEHNLEHRLWNPLHGISSVYQLKGDYQKAKEYGEQGLRSIEGLDEKIAESILLNHMISLTSEFQALDDYIFYLDSYLATLQPGEVGKGDMHLAAYYSTNGNPTERISQIQLAIEKLSKRAPTLSLLSGYHRLGQTHHELEDYHNAIHAWESGLALDQKVQGGGFRLVFSQELARTYQQIGDYRQAYHYLDMHRGVSDSLSNLENMRKIDRLQIQFETVQKENTIQKQQYAINQQARQQRMFLIFAGVFVFFGLVIISILRSRLRLQRMMTYQQKKLHNTELERLKQESRLAALNAMYEGQEEERKRVASDLHDGLGALLTTIKLQLQHVFERNEDLNKSIDVVKTHEMLDSACDEVRRISHNMMPHALFKMGLDAAIQDLVNTIHRSHEMEISFQNLVPLIKLKKGSEISIYRIIQELLQNVIKHAQARQVIVQISQHNGTFSLVVEDDGTGFHVSDRHQEGVGLESVQSRVRFMNGKTTLHSEPGIGTTISIDIPIEEVVEAKDKIRT
jgi:signal transduction histidine kinase